MTNINKPFLISLVATFVFVLAPAYSTCLAQQPDAQPSGQMGDPIRELNLSPEQREKIRGIREEMKEERAAINQRLRQTNQALEEALDSDNPSDAVVEQRLRDVGAAQAASMRMRVLTEVKVRRVLTPEQLGTLRTLRQNARELRRERQEENRDNRRQDGVDRRGLPNQRNGIAPLFPARRNALPKTRP